MQRRLYALLIIGRRTDQEVGEIITRFDAAEAEGAVVSAEIVLGDLIVVKASTKFHVSEFRDFREILN